MGWVVDDIIRRRWGYARRYDAGEWERFLADNGLDYRFARFPVSLPAVIIGNTVVVREGMGPRETAWYVWHEIGHWACHVGNRRFWGSRPSGRLILSKMERQASEFAERFPVWDREGY